MRWASRQLDKQFEVSKNHSESYSEVNENYGESLRFEMYFVLEGEGKMSQSGVTGTVNSLCRCFAMGGQWVAPNGMAERLEFMKPKKVYRQVLGEILFVWD